MKCLIPDKDLSQRLDNTVCMYNGVPVRVKYYDTDQLSILGLSNGKLLKTIESTDPLFDISSPPLGYTQIADGVVAYVSRHPKRIWKQGLSNESAQFDFIVSKNAVQYRYDIFSDYIERTILGHYPTLDQGFEYLKMMSDKEFMNPEVAISREIALKLETNLQLTRVYFKGSCVGVIVKDTRVVITPSDEKGWIISKYLSGLNWKVE